MAPGTSPEISPSPVASTVIPIPTDATNPSVTERMIKIQWTSTKFSRGASDFGQWSRTLEDTMCLNNLDNYIFDPCVPCPNAASEPRAYANWLRNNKLAITFLRSAVADTEHREMKIDDTAKACYQDLKERAQREGPVKQIFLLRDGLAIECDQAVEDLMTTSDKINDLVTRVISLGQIDEEILSAILHLNACHKYEPLQMAVSTGLANSTKSAPFSVTNIRMLWQNYQTLLKSKSTTAGSATALKATTSPATARSRPSHLPGHNHGPDATCCSNCQGSGFPCRGHTKDFCVRKGGGMAGKSISEACAAQNTTKGPAKGGVTPNATTGSSSSLKTYVSVTASDGSLYYVEPSALGKFTVPSNVDFAGIANSPTTSTEDWEYHRFLATQELETSIDWTEHSKSVDDSILNTQIVPISHGERILVDTSTVPFYVDTGATVHISPIQSDFITLRPIPARPVKGVGGSSIAAVGIGNIRLRIARGSYMTLQDALYIPNSTVCLISVSSLSISSGIEATFNSDGVQIINCATRALIASGPLVKKQRLYSLKLYSATAEHAHVATQNVTDIETWHRRLGHANYQTRK